MGPPVLSSRDHSNFLVQHDEGFSHGIDDPSASVHRVGNISELLP